MIHLRKVQWLAVLAVVVVAALGLAESQGAFSSETLVITAIKYEGSLYIMEGGTITSVIVLSPDGQLVPEWTGDGFVFREMNEEEIEARAALIEEVFTILLADEEFSGIIGDASVEIRGLFFSKPSHFLDERDKFAPPGDKPPDDIVSALQDMLPRFVFYHGHGGDPERMSLYALISVDGAMYECALDLESGALQSYHVV
jgi:hypothetical protein